MLREILGKEILYFDGAMGTMLQAAGLQPGELPESWNLTHPEVVVGIHQAYGAQGANIIKTNTFGANRLKFEGTEYALEDVVAAAVKNARQAWDKDSEVPEDRRFVALDMGPTGKLLAPYGDLPFEEAVELYAEIVRAGVKAGADLVLVETMSDTYEAKAAILAAKENSDLPIVVTFTFDMDGKLLNGADVGTAMLMAEGLGVDAAGFNCGLGPEQIVKLLPRARKFTGLPLAVNPNAGLPVQVNGSTVFQVGAEEFGPMMVELAEEGATLLGGCCGTSPDHIGHLVRSTAGRKPVAVPRKEITAVAAYGEPVVFDEMPVLIGERINPTGKPLLKEALREENMDYICRLALEQLDRQVHVLDVNVGLPGTDEPRLLAEAVLALQAITPAPLQIDTAHVSAMEKALRLYNGKPLLNSVNGKEESMEAVFPLVKKYGAAVVALCLDESGIPGDAAGRLAVAEKIIRRAADYGISPKDIIVDPLALTVSTGGENPGIDLEVIATLRSRGIHTVMGVSNISFGLPNRDAVNSSFLAMSLAAGLSSAILNPQSARMMETYYASCALKGLDEGCKAYVARYADMPKTQAAPMGGGEYTLHEAIVKGLTKQSRLAVEKLLAEGQQPLDIINGQMIPALNEVGDAFGKKTLFLPQLLMSADAARCGFDVLKERMADGDKKEDGETIVLAVVKGDIHDIGKNIVKVLWENYGYKVVDLGKDVTPDAVVEAVQKHQAKLVGLSALMTTTVGAMEETIQVLREHCRCNVLVGGAVLTPDYARDIGADGYAATAVDAVNYANRILREKLAEKKD